ncbi:GH3 family domain-containing protein [Flavihumibacter profundi]|uniref:GH3 family domain-containing protein n=1 Tax=Flavihumibacter profundi TaxID=2716883 RepID=UPI001CC64BCA|nr:GH3 auxin-responsive promoter family protein [Flavihumibacter profundi]MBZ5859048.1 GH3 auxin-responsive promoter family protein [Flavihumibacter profundi]
MPLIEISLPKTIARALRLPASSPRGQQLKVLKKLLKKARFTEFGQHYRFDEILLSRHPGKRFQQLVPTHDYSSIYQQWWHRTLEGKRDVCWPGRIKYYALSSGTSEAASKYIPITEDLLKGNRTVMVKQLFSLRHYDDIPFSNIGKGWLMLGGSTQLQRGQGYYAGDLSGITAKKVPFWFTPFYKPGRKIAKMNDWNDKLDEIVEQAPNWDISFVVGVPAWIQMCMEKIIERYQLKTIHDIWPNLSFFVHGGVSFEPYKKGFEKLLAKPLTYIETYLASEGFIAYQDRQHAKGMKLSINDHIFFEFIPFDDENFDAEGNMVPNPKSYMIHEVEEGRDYALLISTSAGAWRYLIGDTIRFSDIERCEVIITGRTKHFLSLVGEHLSVDNMNRALQLASEELNVSIPEYTVAGIPYGNFFAHHWYVASNDHVDKAILLQKIDQHLKELNDDYIVERKSALKEVFLDVLPESKFMEFMASKGKVGGQHKFPRVLKGKMLQDWQAFLGEPAV